ncbi:outer membrane protein assembly factor BamD [Veronia nyctiphanis]|uniref:Outer membrane protein assembly factor BamD n=1 Tax=Veronia nyctiphanis TaxID=1278244 RepID=A0A4Q0YK14_9GAMM|nr:outer membrane protein assembly factor BamD [Veronia nyctiphanis]RXJ71060.1 outer membrane protein assembly factor BamD [Veronia nyctiphanis]
MKRLTLSTLFAAILLAGCSSADKGIVPDVPPSELYQEAKQAIDDGQWVKAVEKLEAMDSRYPFGAYSEQVQFDLIFAYYKNGDYVLAESTIDRFLRMNPNHNNLDWVLYMRGLSNMAQDSSLLHEFLNMERSDRDPQPVSRAFFDFKQLLDRYPNSPYAADARARMVSLKNRLADYELATADFYVRREAWMAAINRCQAIQQQFGDTEAARKALPLMVKAYEALGLTEPAERAKQQMALNGVL